MFFFFIKTEAFWLLFKIFLLDLSFKELALRQNLLFQTNPFKKFKFPVWKMKQAKHPFSTNVNICDEKQIVTFSSLQNVIRNLVRAISWTIIQSNLLNLRQIISNLWIFNMCLRKWVTQSGLRKWTKIYLRRQRGSIRQKFVRRWKVSISAWGTVIFAIHTPYVVSKGISGDRGGVFVENSYVGEKCQFQPEGPSFSPFTHHM